MIKHRKKIIALLITVGLLGIVFFAFAAPIQRQDVTIVPIADSTYDLGTSSPRWRNIYTNTLDSSGTVTADNFIATSTTATSTFAGGLTVDTSDFVVDPDAGRIGIGTVSPSNILDIESSGTDTRVEVRSTGLNSASLLDLFNDARNWNLGINSNDEFRIRDVTAGNSRLSIDSSGNIVINEDSTASSLRIESDVQENAFFIDTNGEIGINNATPNGSVDIQVHDTGASRYFNIGGTINPSGGTTQLIRAVPSLDIAGNHGTHIGFNLNTFVGGSTSNTLSNLESLRSALTFNDSFGGTITNVPLIHVFNPIDSSSGSPVITNLRGLEIEDLTYGTNNHAIYVDGSTQSYFGGNVGIGSTTPGAHLAVQNGATFSYMNAGDSSFTISSDENLKENFVQLSTTTSTNILTAIANTPIYNFNFATSTFASSTPSERTRLSTLKRIGFKAQEFFTQINPFTNRGNNAAINGDDISSALWLSVQELIKENTALKARLRTLEVLHGI